MEKNSELRHAWDFVEHTSISIFLTGKAGTGKQHFSEHSKKRVLNVVSLLLQQVVAAINAGE